MKKGHSAWNKGLKGFVNGGTFKKGHKGINIPKFEDNRNWKGNNVGYTALHKWVKKIKGKANTCNICFKNDKKQYDWANISGEYKRDVNDWVSLCRSCHIKMDRKNKVNAKEIFINQNRKYDN